MGCVINGKKKNNRGKRMSWAVGFDPDLGRDIGYGVPSVCDHPDCSEEIDRGLGYVCGGLPYGGEQGCGLFFCEDHKELDLTTYNRICERCEEGKEPFLKKDDTNEWKMWKIMDESWEKWRESNPEAVASLKNDLQILHLTLKKQWFDEILSGNKKKEYRKVKQYWVSRLCADTDEDSEKTTVEIKRFDYVVFRNGYKKDAPLFAIECKDITIGKDIETPMGRGDYFVISLCRILGDF